jgi:hypothetical protein
MNGRPCETDGSLVEELEPYELQAPWVNPDGSTPVVDYIEKKDWDSLDQDNAVLNFKKRTQNTRFLKLGTALI